MTEPGPQDPPAATSHPDAVGRYDLLLPIASGGMATVYLARAKGVGGFARDVALKLSHAHLRERHEFTVALMDEARIAARIHHPNVVNVLDIGEEAVGVYLVMDYVAGESLSGLMQRAGKRGDRLPLRIGLRVLLDAIAGLAAAHELRGDDGELLHVVHRDFSPQNIIVATDGVSRLTDFGIAKATHRLTQTASGLVKGKLRYMSPEQARARDVDHRADIWAAGVLAWELVTGRPLLKAGNQVEALLTLVQSVPPRASSVVPFVPTDVDAVIARALAPAKEDRYQSAADMVSHLLVAARAADLVAEHAEVAEYVDAQVGKKLRDRGERVREIVTQRARRANRAGRLRASSTESSKPAPLELAANRDAETVVTVAGGDTETDMAPPVVTEVVEAPARSRNTPPPAPPPPQTWDVEALPTELLKRRRPTGPLIAAIAVVLTLAVIGLALMTR